MERENVQNDLVSVCGCLLAEGLPKASITATTATAPNQFDVKGKFAKYYFEYRSELSAIPRVIFAIEVQHKFKEVLNM